MGFSSSQYWFSVLIILCCFMSDLSIAKDIITSSQFIKDPQTLSSKDGNFTLGFFNPKNSTNRYVGIWWKTQSTVIWVCNRNHPLNDSSGIVTISENGNLVVMDGQKHVIWSTDVVNITSNTSSQFSDNGNLVLMESTSGNTIWESFQHPSDTLLPRMKLSSNKRTSDTVKLTSWKSPSNPSTGSFSSSTVQRFNLIEVFIWNGTQPYWRSGPWNGDVFTGIQHMATSYLNGFHAIDDGEGNVEVYYTRSNDLPFVLYNLNSTGQYQQLFWDDDTNEMHVTWTSHESDCDSYGICGPFAICDSQNSPICKCLRGFEPRNTHEWNRQNWTGGCVRRTPLQCERVNNKNTSNDRKEDGFMKLKMIKVPDYAQGSAVTPDKCRSQCLESCSCIAYSHDDSIGCMSWTENLLDTQQLSKAGLDLYVRVAYTELDKGTNTTMIITITVIIGTIVIVICVYVKWRRTSMNPAKLWHYIKFSRKKNSKVFLLFNKGETSEEYTSNNTLGELSQVKLQELLLFNLEKLANATNNFHRSNKLGEGGFGPVYKGKLQDGQEIAVKRLSRTSGQGTEQFMTEVMVISKLQHRNLVRLLGCCIEGDEKMLIYEYMPNKSLDEFIFDPSKNKHMDWKKRSSIIEGIARGMLYLHRDSRLRIIHRDLKTSNVLLDEELNPKISDFGMARIIGGSQHQANTNRVVGTYGYMSPEYAMHGLFSEKSDVFSFGVLILEIVSGRRNSSFYDNGHASTLLGYAWIKWMEGDILPLVDAGIYDPMFDMNIIRCIHIGFLCVQEHAADRPTMAAIISMLNSEITNLPPPKQPAFILRDHMLSSVSFDGSHGLHSTNYASFTDIYGR